MRLILLVIKFGLLGLLYLFILRVFYVILRDLRGASGHRPERPKGQPAGAGAELVVTESNDAVVKLGEIIRLTGQTRIGRGAHNEVRLTDTFASNDHAQIIFRHEKFFLEDLDSVNGTYINGVRISKPTPLVHKDLIRVAGLTLKFVRWEYEVE